MCRTLRLVIFAEAMLILMLLASGKSNALHRLLGNPICDTNDNFLHKVWVLTHEYDPTKQQFAPLAKLDTLSFLQTKVYINGKQLGTYSMQQQKATLSFKFSEKQIPAFAHYPIAGSYHFRYALDNSNNTLLLTPLDEQEVEDLITVEGRTLLFALAR